MLLAIRVVRQLHRRSLAERRKQHDDNGALKDHLEYSPSAVFFPIGNRLVWPDDRVINLLATRISAEHVPGVFPVALNIPHLLAVAKGPHRDKVQSPECKFPPERASGFAGFDEQQGVGVRAGVKRKDSAVFRLASN